MSWNAQEDSYKVKQQLAVHVLSLTHGHPEEVW
jgi:hypothetical protein